MGTKRVIRGQMGFSSLKSGLSHREHGAKSRHPWAALPRPIRQGTRRHQVAGLARHSIPRHPRPPKSVGRPPPAPASARRADGTGTPRRGGGPCAFDAPRRPAEGRRRMNSNLADCLSEVYADRASAGGGAFTLNVPGLVIHQGGGLGVVRSPLQKRTEARPDPLPPIQPSNLYTGHPKVKQTPVADLKGHFDRYASQICFTTAPRGGRPTARSLGT